jgi:hypothetical protein
MKNYIILFVLLQSSLVINAQKFVSKDGHIWFFSHTPIEDIEAHNHQVASILDAGTGDLSFSLLMKSFGFQKALMQEHFNENYVESDKFPKSTFKGKIVNNNSIDYRKNGTNNAEVSGDLTIHGITRQITAKGTIEVKDGKISVLAKFIISPADYEIKIPSLVEGNIARNIDVNVDVTYNPYSK